MVSKTPPSNNGYHPTYQHPPGGHIGGRGTWWCSMISNQGERFPEKL